MTTDELVAATRAILVKKAIRTFDEPVQLASGAFSRHFVDAKAGLAEAADLGVACAAMTGVLRDAGIEFDAVGGPTLGACHLAVGVALQADSRWFFVRKEPKNRGTGRQIEGVDIGPGHRVVVVEDVVSTGGSMLDAIDAVQASGAEIVAVTTMLDRGDVASASLAARSIPYFPITGYADFDMDPVTAPSSPGGRPHPE